MVSSSMRCDKLGLGRGFELGLGLELELELELELVLELELGLEDPSADCMRVLVTFAALGLFFLLMWPLACQQKQPRPSLWTESPRSPLYV